MSDIEFSSKMDVELVDHMGSDKSVIRAAKVSTLNDQNETTDEYRFIKFLMHGRHMSPFEHCVATFRIDAPIFVWREFMRHRTMCVSGDTVITLTNATEKRYQTIQTLWDNRVNGVPDARTRTGGEVVYRRRTKDWIVRRSSTLPNGARTTESVGPFATETEAKTAQGEVRPYRRRKLPSVYAQHIVCVDEATGLGTSAPALDVIQSGIKPVWEVTTEHGDRVKTTLDHKFRTPSGYRELRDLSVGDEVHVFGNRGVSDRDPLVSKELRAGIGHWTQALRQTKYKPSDAFKCYMCETALTYDQMELDHVLPVVTHLELALTEDNVRPACRGCHRTKTTLEQRHRRRGRTHESAAVPVKITAIEFVGDEMTYDICMPAPNNNFIANNFVVHNSFNEQSGRYTEMRPKFYVTDEHRPLVQTGKAGEYTFVEGSDDQKESSQLYLEAASRSAWHAYQELLDNGVAKEVARMVLPVNIYSTAYVTGKLRNWLQFLSLRTNQKNAMFPSYPQREIEMVADKIEDELWGLYRYTMLSWNEEGRVGL